MSDWITDRPPTEADGDSDGDVFVQMRPGAPNQPVYLHWSYVKPGVPWHHSPYWTAPAPAPEPAAEPVAEPAPAPAAVATQPRRFSSTPIRTILANGDHILDAIDDEGIAWWMRLDTQPDHPAFPPKDPGWQQLSPLPARELPTEADF